ncbi:HAD-IA family hydrolase [Streptomyces sp. NBC_00838]|uniref:HAD-IA family hydrolase n=1 Tax=Streptomyces sp. NBC_00838 TaxID=2903680 RepID=UPI0038671323|nr:HAD-IA family hydrolase [Streptomyces sp. NBC_00838]
MSSGATRPGAREPAFDAVLCDIDGVIRFFDLSEVSRLERAAGLPEGTTASVGFAPENDLPLLLGRITREEWADSIVRGLLPRVTPYEAEALARAFSTAGFRADEGVVDLLRYVREHCPLVLVTNATRWLDDDLALLGLTGLAHSVVNSSLVGVAKPDRRIYEIAAERAGVAPDRCLFVDDRQENVDAAVALGMTGVLHRDATDLRTALLPVAGRAGAGPPDD